MSAHAMYEWITVSHLIINEDELTGEVSKDKRNKWMNELYTID